MNTSPPDPGGVESSSEDAIDLVEWYFDQGWSDGLPVVPPTPKKVAAMVSALGENPERVEARIPPRWGSLTREVLAANMVMAGCKPAYAPVVRSAGIDKRIYRSMRPAGHRMMKDLTWTARARNLPET